MHGVTLGIDVLTNVVELLYLLRKSKLKSHISFPIYYFIMLNLHRYIILHQVCIDPLMSAVHQHISLTVLIRERENDTCETVHQN